MSNGRLEGKVALVSGSGRGIGRAIALKLASEGARVVVNDLDADPAQEVVEAIKSANGEAIACLGSVSEPDFGERFVAAAMSNYGGLDIIVNNAGFTWDSVIQKMTDEQFDAVMDVHLKAPFRILRAAAEPIRTLSKQEALAGKVNVRKVVNISSVAGTNGNPGQANYSSAKAGVTGLTKTLAREWGRYKVTVNCVAFNYIQTRLTMPLGGEQAQIDVEGRLLNVGVQQNVLTTLDATIPLGRGGTPEEAAGSVYLFCIPESDYVSGQVLMCSGGL
ncbi:3-oxoacyl-ACP reductase [Rhizorhabdus wittichii DC-6]|uniref:Short-chain dehydrogenase/reductase SDR n=1 Tax=Rhizorhabdus wittichii (strain DSM 6014 / CCUG 31198 / JCM 15750 / NBRC 105917 / EY 4224 / RW1) TaxID=392499 RepID=A0A9J9LDL8_RHIWR|nr:SDR family oxidoreductase [Rhizorhabdus wittichii]ABQ67970.1 short-chain dehydrogenase/reductase SDR [Rhizorhabdus wittichii RW1]ARR55119.1 3-oxoacyl-ACP reductase [Rhizorhabdus wittichii DC-6]